MKKEILYTENIAAAKKEIAELKGKVSQEFTSQLFVAELPADVSKDELQFSSTPVANNLTKVAKLAFDSWTSYTLKDAAENFAPDHREGLSWDTEGFQSPKSMRPLIFPSNDLGGLQLSSNTPTSLYMTETVSVGLVIVSGPGKFAFSDREIKLVISEVQEALQFLSSAEPRAKLSFIYDIRPVIVDAVAGDPADFESAESPWRDAALEQLGYSPSRQGSIDYVNGLIAQKNTKWAYVAYFTKYPIAHFAYAIDEKLVMHLDNDGWGPDAINKVFAHETCHLFGAADEYGNCSCNSVHGYLNVPNANCRSCAPEGVDCLMDRNILSLCNWSRKQIGWDESLFPKS